MRSHDLNRLLDKPGCEASTVWKYLLQFHGWRILLGGPKPPAPMDQTVIATAPRQNAYFVGSRPALISSCGRTHPQHPQRHGRTDGVGANYVPRVTSRPIAGGLCNGWQYPSPHDHHGRAATSAQQLGSWRRRGGWGRRAQRLFEHQQLQQRNQTLAVGCKKPKLRARRKPLGNTCCMSSQRKVAPLTVRCAVFLVLLSRQR